MARQQRERIREYVDVFLDWLLKTAAVQLDHGVALGALVAAGSL